MTTSVLMRLVSVACFVVAGLVFLGALHIAHGGPAFTEFGVAAWVTASL